MSMVSESRRFQLCKFLLQRVPTASATVNTLLATNSAPWMLVTATCILCIGGSVVQCKTTFATCPRSLRQDVVVYKFPNSNISEAFCTSNTHTSKVKSLKALKQYSVATPTNRGVDFSASNKHLIVFIRPSRREQRRSNCAQAATSSKFGNCVT